MIASNTYMTQRETEGRLRYSFPYTIRLIDPDAPRPQSASRGFRSQRE